MKHLRKALSILLVAVMFVSACTCLVGTVGAYTISKSLGTTALSLDFTDNLGIADVRQDMKMWEYEFKNDGDEHGDYFTITNSSFQGYSFVLGNEDAEVAQSSATTTHPDRFTLEPNTTYTLTFDYKYGAGSTNRTPGYVKCNAANHDDDTTNDVADGCDHTLTAIGMWVEFYKCKVAQPGLAKTGFGSGASLYISDLDESAYTKMTLPNRDYTVTTINGSDSPIPETYEGYKLTEDTEWYTYTRTFTTDDLANGNNSLCISLSAGSSTVMEKDTDAVVGDDTCITFCLDNVVITKDSVTGKSATTSAKGTTYVYDFMDNDGNMMTATDFGSDGTGVNQCHAWFSNSNTSNGNKSYFVNDGTDVGAVFTSTTGGVPALTTNAAGGWVHKMYLQDPDFKIGNYSGTVGKYGFLKIETGHVYEITLEFKAYGTTVGTEVTAGIGISANNNGGSASTVGGLASATAAADATGYTYVTASVDGDDNSWTGNTNGALYSVNEGRYICIVAQTNKPILIKSVTVTVYDKNAYTESANELSINFDNGLNDLYLPNGDGNNYGNIEIAEDPNGYGYGNSLKVTGTRTTGTTFTFGLAAKPGLGTVSGSNAYTSGADGFKVTLGKTYKVSFDIYCAAVDEGYGSNAYACYVAGASGVGAPNYKQTQGKTTYTGAALGTVKSKAGDGIWRHFEYTFTAASPDDASWTYLLIGWSASANDSTGTTDEYSAVTYLDNIVVTDMTNMADEDIENTKRSIRAESGSGDDYVSAGIRFRGEIATATAEAAEEIGFVVAPEALVNAYTGTDKWYTVNGNAAALASAKVAKVKTASKEVLYGINGSNNQYQLLISKLTQEDADTDLLSTYFAVVMYTKAADGTYTYYNVETSSYREVLNAYINKGVDGAEYLH